jgi:uncharacterized protein (DUF2225 family)
LVLAEISEIKKRLNQMFGNNTEMVGLYIERFGSHLSISNINKIREEYKDQIEREASAADALFETDLTCPICGTEKVIHQELKAKSQIISFDPFMTPIYKPIEGFKSVNYSLYSVTVCHKCYYASPDRKDFKNFSLTSRVWEEAKLTAISKSDLVDTMAERMSIVEEEGDAGFGLFDMPRNVESGILSYKMAIERAHVETRNKEKAAWTKKGYYWGKIALLIRQGGESPKPYLEEMAKCFEQSFFYSDYPSAVIEFQTLYVLSALKLYLGNRKDCRKYMSELDKIKAEYKNGIRTDRSQGKLDSWIDKGQRLWESREEEDLWDLPK